MSNAPFEGKRGVAVELFMIDGRPMMDGGHGIRQVGQDRRLVKTEGWSRQKVGQDRRLVETEGWSRQKVGQDRRLVKTEGWSRQVGQDRLVPPSHQGSKVLGNSQHV
ncbi:hypothetical protein N7491_000725 [Penicillium cf. griseofulvum]|uniref:Uncharacterized protein n=1 Tax=Penicillium cf. griseofulvum TaxID=2972120 RepID=A0A9W9IQD7_9EURO|nr:hypothetical protein N7472_011130 [Penicillium cf. griseofulvum]KAJ5451543.1 hypothetical protein N7491_000725 [Penicillium cf. griseofulvum]